MPAEKRPELHDRQTGLPGRALLMDRLEHALRRSRRPRSKLGALFIGLDSFASAPAGHGSQPDRHVLTGLAPRLLEELRPGDTVARLDQDLVVLCESLVDEAGAISVAERILRAVSRPVALGEAQHVVIASIGIVVVDAAETTAEEVLRSAEAAMQVAKSNGGNRYELHDAGMRDRVLAHFQAERELHAAIEEEQLRLYYQPLISLSDGCFVGAEALVRWEHPTRGLLLPGEFIPLAERSDAIFGLGRWVIERALADTASWQHAHPGLKMSVSLNLSPRQVAAAGIPRVVRDALERSGADPERIQLEITESALFDGGESPERTLQALKDLGVELVLDDFGTGYSSLSYLKRFPIDAIKIDRSFVSGLALNRADTAIVAGLITIATALGIGVVAEGVENELQVSNLQELGCGYAQGFYFSRPLPAEVFVQYMNLAAQAAGLRPAASTRR